MLVTYYEELVQLQHEHLFNHTYQSSSDGAGREQLCTITEKMRNE